jgi:hypothetical protein
VPWFETNLLSIHPLRVGRYESGSSKVLTLVSHLRCFDSRLNRFHTPLVDGLFQKQLFNDQSFFEREWNRSGALPLPLPPPTLQRHS